MPARAQCPRCQHFQMRGGAAFPAYATCMPLEAENPPASLAVLRRLSFDLAARGRCPNFSPFPPYPDAYRAQDLPGPSR